jgi:hypothetical protein
MWFKGKIYRIGSIFKIICELWAIGWVRFSETVAGETNELFKLQRSFWGINLKWITEKLEVLIIKVDDIDDFIKDLIFLWLEDSFFFEWLTNLIQWKPQEELLQSMSSGLWDTTLPCWLSLWWHFFDRDASSSIWHRLFWLCFL